MAGSTNHHVILFPYMSKGHTIPLLQFGRLLLRHHRNEQIISVTVFTTPKNQPFISEFLSDTPEISVISLPFPENISGIPPGVESTEKLPSMSLFVPFTRATKLLQPFFEETLKSLPQVSFMVTDGFLWWTSESAAKFKIPRLVFYGTNSYAFAVLNSTLHYKLFTVPEIKSDSEPVTVPDFPWIQVKKCDFEHVLTDPKQSGPAHELLMDHVSSSTTTTSHGYLVNSFYELESAFVDHENNNNSDRPKSWCVGPLCLTDPPKSGSTKPAWIRWLDRKQEEVRPVLYVAFGTQTEISNKQLKELALGLEDSKVNFLWVTRKDVEEILGQGFKDRIRESGIIVRDWVDQWEILSHESVKGFLSHCGWNSAQESIYVGVPLMAWPMMAEQPLNAKLVVEEIKVGVRVETQDGSVQGFVTRGELSRKIKELMEGETGKIARKNVKEYSKMAKAALVEGTGSSWKNLDLILKELCKSRESNGAND
ncbi:PREDICTED: UDP-glycosyltransferase 90A1-like [Camelina sativa]|uniref:Glycosyltransferase n=1 Tax=Camelina sativa TaxID=90675 RepID=A0ABM0ZI04_CAMSA|nr:PREDICTED: UDP-glycosyltransferase 90A1-like [Camelina sativa]